MYVNKTGLVPSTEWNTVDRKTFCQYIYNQNSYSAGYLLSLLKELDLITSFSMKFIPFDFLSPQRNWRSTDKWVTSIGIHLSSCLHCIDVYVFIIADEEAWKQVSCKCMLLLNLLSSSSNNLWKENIYNFGRFWKGNNYQKFWLFCLRLQIHCLRK